MFGLKQIIEEPTRITCTSKSLFDHISCYNQETIVQAGVIPIGLKDKLARCLLPVEIIERGCLATGPATVQLLPYLLPY